MAVKGLHADMCYLKLSFENISGSRQVQHINI